MSEREKVGRCEHCINRKSGGNVFNDEVRVYDESNNVYHLSCFLLYYKSFNRVVSGVKEVVTK